MSRMPWPLYFMQITRLVAQRSTCLRRKVGAIAVMNKRILATGYNGAPAGMTDCLEKGCLRQAMGIPSGQRHEICTGLHAEQNIIIQAAVHGVSLAGAVLYCTHQPCLICTKMIINCGFTAVYFAEPYPDPLGEAMLREAGVPCELMADSAPATEDAPLPHGEAPVPGAPLSLTDVDAAVRVSHPGGCTTLTDAPLSLPPCRRGTE